MVSQQVESQNRFSQFYSSPLLFNPANTGRFNKSFRIGGSFRSEKNAVSVYNQSVFSIESKILNSIIPENDCFAIGLIGLSEQSPGEGIKNSYLSISLGYQKGLNQEGDQQIGLGFQTTLGHKRIEPPVYIFEDQVNAWISSGFTNIDISRVTIIDVTYLDLNVGLVYQGKINAKNFITAGGSVYHANKPRKFFQGGELNLARQWWTHFGWESNLPDNRKIYSAMLLSFSKKNIEDLFLGMLYQINIKKFNQLQIGGWVRNNHLRGTSFIPTAGISYTSFILKLSYDINISPKNSLQKGASEISLTYTQAKTRSRFLENKFVTY